MDLGVPYLFFQPSTSKTGATSAYGILGNPYLGLTYSAKGSALDFSTSLNSANPTASTAKGLSTGHVTVDWSNHFAHGFDLFTPFVDLGLANSIPDTRFLHRPYISYGDVAHGCTSGATFNIIGGTVWISPECSTPEKVCVAKPAAVNGELETCGSYIGEQKLPRGRLTGLLGLSIRLQ